MSKKNRNKNNRPVEVAPIKPTVEEVNTPSDEPVKTANFFAKVCNVDNLNIRKVPGGDILEVVKRDSILKMVANTPIHALETDWYPVITPMGTEGVAMSQFLYIYEEGEFQEV